MLIKKYLAKEVYANTCVISGILVLIFLSTQLVRFLGRAAAGKLTGLMLMKIMGLEIPILLGLLLPVGLYIGILMAYGRMYVDSEMTVLQACGLSQAQLLKYTQIFSILILGLTLFLNLYLTPLLLRDKDKILAANPASILIGTLVPGRFKTFGDQNVVYVEGMDHNINEANHIFVARREWMSPNSDAPGENKTEKTQAKVPIWRVLSAAKAYQTKNAEIKGDFIMAENGTEYSGIPGQGNFRVIHFKKYGVRVPDADSISPKKEFDSLPLSTLWDEAKTNLEAMAELQWRISLPLSVPILVLLAIPLSRVSPRQGRYRQLIPAILIYSIYANMQFVARSWLKNGTIPSYVGLWALHAIVLILALSLYIDPYRWRQYKAGLLFWKKRA